MRSLPFNGGVPFHNDAGAQFGSQFGDQFGTRFGALLRAGARSVPGALAALALALALASCSRSDPSPQSANENSGAGASAPATKALVVGFSQVGAESAWRTAETQSMKDAAAARAVKLIFADAQGRQANQVQALRSFVAQGVDAIVLAPVVSTGWEPVLRDAKAANIPVILVDRGIETTDPGLYATLIASDFVEEGRMAARWLAERTNGTCNIVELQGTTGSAPAIDRQRGFAEIVAQHPGMKVVKSQSADFERAKGKEVMEAFIKSVGRSGGGAINAVYAHNDDMALGAIQALEEAGMKPGTDVLVVSIDAVRPAFDAMVAGTLNASVECNPLLGPLAFDAIDRLRRGETLPKFMKQEDRLFVKEKAADEIAKREY